MLHKLNQHIRVILPEKWGLYARAHIYQSEFGKNANSADKCWSISSFVDICVAAIGVRVFQVRSLIEAHLFYFYQL